MKNATTYLNFDGNAREAMTFYASCLDAKLDTQSFADVKMPSPPGSENRLVHARLESGPVILMASDTMPGMQFVQGNNAHICIDCDSSAELDKLFASIGEGGKVTMPVADTFWGARFGMLTDRFGVQWMFNADKPKS